MGISGLRQQGYASADAFKVGPTFKVTYNPNRDGSVGGHLVTMVDQTTGAVYGRDGPGAAADPPPPLPAVRPTNAKSATDFPRRRPKLVTYRATISLRGGEGGHDPRRTAGLAAAASRLALAGALADAHHSIGSTVDTDKQVVQTTWC